MQLGRYRFPFPPELEQRDIVTFLDRETARIDGLVTGILGAIDGLKEFRAALISAAVTGRIDVRALRHSGESRNPEQPVA